MLQCVMVRCSVFSGAPRVAGCCSVLQRVGAVCYNGMPRYPRVEVSRDCVTSLIHLWWSV